MANQKKKKPTIDEQIKDLKSQIVANSKDAEWTKKMLAKLTSLQRGALVEPVELIVPQKEVQETIDMGSCKISRTIRGYLLEAKGGMFTFVNNRMASVCAMLNTLFELNKPEKVQSEEDKELFDSFSSAVLYVFQGLIFSSLKDEMLFGIATDILTRFNAYCQENVDNAELHEETAEDIEKNIAFENMGQAMQNIADSPLPQAE